MGALLVAEFEIFIGFSKRLQNLLLSTDLDFSEDKNENLDFSELRHCGI